MIQELKVATSRVGVLIGKAGATKKELESKTHTTISIDSKEGLVKVEGAE
ncbi:MAG: KH domain-containing protein, partial [Methanoregula sp.]